MKETVLWVIFRASLWALVHVHPLANHEAMGGGGRSATGARRLIRGFPVLTDEHTTERQRLAAALRGAGLTWKEIGRRLGVSRQRAQQAARPAADRERQRRRTKRATPA